MQCEDAIDTLQTVGSHSEAELRDALAHAVACEECRAAMRAIDALHSSRDDLVPVPSDGAVERALDRALASSPAQRYRRGFWRGVASGAAIAATIAAIAVGIALRPTADDSLGIAPEVRVSVNEPRDVTVTLDSPEPLANAQVRVELRGAVALDGYASQRELRWSTNLDRGVNQLTLPVVALDTGGGQVLVEVTHGAKRRTFVLDVRATSAG